MTNKKIEQVIEIIEYLIKRDEWRFPLEVEVGGWIYTFLNKKHAQDQMGWLMEEKEKNKLMKELSDEMERRFKCDGLIIE